MKRAEFMQIFGKDCGANVQALLSHFSTYGMFSSLFSVPADCIIKITR
jgi:hypothetical protein